MKKDSKIINKMEINKIKIEIKQIKTNKIIEMNKIKIKNNNSCYGGPYSYF
jgi:hypothetical protein